MKLSTFTLEILFVVASLALAVLGVAAWVASTIIANTGGARRSPLSRQIVGNVPEPSPPARVIPAELRVSRVA